MPWPDEVVVQPYVVLDLLVEVLVSIALHLVHHGSTKGSLMSVLSWQGGQRSPPPVFRKSSALLATWILLLHCAQRTIGFCFMVPLVGLEPTTVGLKVHSSTS